MSGISTHILDTARGCPADGVPVKLERQTSYGWTVLGSGRTDADGRVRNLTSGAALEVGVHRISFEVQVYHDRLDIEGFYPRASIEFNVRDASAHFHVPLLLSPFGFSTYRGS